MSKEQIGDKPRELDSQIGGMVDIIEERDKDQAKSALIRIKQITPLIVVTSSMVFLLDNNPMETRVPIWFSYPWNLKTTTVSFKKHQ